MGAMCGCISEVEGILVEPHILNEPGPHKPLLLYITVDNAISSVLVQGIDDIQRPIYSVNKVLQGLEV